MVKKHVIFIAFLLFPFLLTSCFKDETPDNAALYGSPDFYVKFNDGQAVEYRQTIAEVIAEPQSLAKGYEYVEACHFLKRDSKVGEAFSISLSKIIFNTPTQSQTDSLFNIGVYRNFGPSNGQQVVATIQYTDAQGIFWSTTLGKEQSGSILQIKTNQISAGPGFRYKVTGSFSCNLYSSAYYSKYVSGDFVAKFGVGN